MIKLQIWWFSWKSNKLSIISWNVEEIKFEFWIEWKQDGSLNEENWQRVKFAVIHNSWRHRQRCKVKMDEGEEKEKKEKKWGAANRKRSIFI